MSYLHPHWVTRTEVSVSRSVCLQKRLSPEGSVCCGWDVICLVPHKVIFSFLGGASGKESTCQCMRHKRWGFDPWVGKIPLSRKWQLQLATLQYFRLRNPMDRGARQGTVHGVAKFSSVQSLSHVWLFATPWTAACQASLSPSTSPGACSNSCPSSWWCHPTISSSVMPFSSCLQSFPASGSSPLSHFFASCGQNIVASASASVLPMNIRDWFPLGFDLLAVQGTL